MKSDIEITQMPTKFGISQGRLTPSDQLQRFPSEAWQLEFSNAKKIGLTFIELLTERHFNKNNPVWSSIGRQEIRGACATSGCEIYSICIDYIIDHSMLDDGSKATLKHVEDVFVAAADLGCEIVIFPLLEKSNLDLNSADQFVQIFLALSKKARKYNLTICVESLMKASDLVSFLERVDEDNVRAVFDTGNRVIQHDGNDLYGEILRLNKFIKHIHIKDKTSDGENVILGTGLVDFRSVFLALRKIDYEGPLNFETTRGRDPLATAAFHIALCEFFKYEVSLI